MWVLPLDLVRAFFVFTLRVFLLLLFFEGNKGDQLHRGGTGRPQVQGRVSRIASLRLDVDLARVLLLDQSNARIVLHRLLSSPPISITARRVVAYGAARQWAPGNWSRA